MSEFSWLFISDLHLKSDYTTWNQSVVLRDLVRDLEARKNDHPPIRFVVVSGDLAHGGKEGQYALVESFLDELISTLSLTRHDVYLVPGNHDIDRDVNQLAFHGARSQFSNANTVEKFLSRDSERQALLKRLKAYYDFDSHYCDGLEREYTDDGLAYICRRRIGDLPIGIVGLNSVDVHSAKQSLAQIREFGKTPAWTGCRRWNSIGIS